jgi:hypothetical protein
VYFERKKESNYLIKHIKFNRCQTPQFPRISSDKPVFNDILRKHSHSDTEGSQPHTLNIEQSMFLPLIESPQKSRLETSFTELDPCDLILTEG